MLNHVNRNKIPNNISINSNINFNILCIMKPNNFNPDLPYRIVEVILYNGIYYKIMQAKPPFHLWTWQEYKDVVCKKDNEVIYFTTQEIAKEFINYHLKKNEDKKHAVVVFDSLKDK